MHYHEIHRIATYMDARGRITRSRPPTGLPLAERYSQVERLIDALWDISRELGVSLGGKPTLVMTGDSIAPPSALLARLTLLEVEVGATVVMCGLANMHGRALYELCNTRPGEPTPNYRKIVDEELEDHPSDIE